MTRVHRVPRYKRVAHEDQDLSRSFGAARDTGLFFKPTDYRTACNTECAFQSTQTTAFLIGTKDFFFAFWSIGRTAGVLATLPSARAAPVLLLAIGGDTIFSEIRTAAMPTCDKPGNHSVKPFT